jgi:peroxiredoxin
MHNILLLIFIPLLISCSSGKEEKVIITGKLENSNGETLILEQLTFSQSIVKDSTKVNKDGYFEIKTNLPEKGFYRLKINPQNFIILILDTIENINIAANAKNLADGYKIEGTSEDSKLLQNLNEQLKISAIKRDSLQRVFMSKQGDPNINQIGLQLESEYNAIINNQVEYIKNFIRENNQSFASLAAIEQLNPETDLEYFKILHDGLNEKFPNSSYVQVFTSRYKELSKLAIGAEAPDIIMNTPTGETLSLSSLKGKIVLIDFWASWCKPCRMENPNVVKLYNKYKDKGFEILGVSLDREKSAWLQAIKEDNLTWKHVSDLAFWNSSVVKQYNINGVPYTVLVDREGRIIAKGLRGPQLEKKLEEIFKDL